MSIDSDATNTDRTADQTDSPESARSPRSSSVGDGETTRPGKEVGFSTKSVHAGERRQKPEGSISGRLCVDTFMFLLPVCVRFDMFLLR